MEKKVPIQNNVDILESISDCFYTLDKELRFIYANKAAEEIWGLSQADLIGHRIEDVFPGLIDISLIKFRQALEEHKPQHFEVYSKVIQRWGDMSVYPTRDGISVCFRDTTKRKRLEQQQALLSDVSHELVGLNTIEETVDRLAEKIGQYFGVVWAMYAELVKNNEYSIASRGWNADGAISLRGTYRMRDFLTDEQLKRNNAGDLTIVADTQTDPRVSAETYGALGIRSFIILPISRDGQWRFQLSIIDIKPREWREDEVSLLKEIADRIWTRVERVRAEEALRESERVHAFQSAILDSVRDPLWVTDPDLRIVYWNDAAAAVFGWTADEAMGQHTGELFRTLVPGSTREEAAEKALRTGDFLGECVLHGKVGNPIFIEGRCHAVRGPDGEVLRFVNTARDITSRKKLEEELAFQALTLASLQEAICAVDGNFIITYWNEMAEETFGWTAQDAVGSPSKDIFRVISPSNREESIENLLNNNGYSGEAIYRRKDGKEVHTSVICSVMRDTQGNYRGNVSSFRDITESKRIEMALRESEERFSKAFWSSPAALAITRLSDGTYIEVNDGVLEMMGYSREEMVGHTSLELNVYADPDGRDDLIRTLQTKGSVVNKYIRFRAKGGRIVDAFLSMELVTAGGETLILSTMLDITERKRAEEALRESEEKYRLLFNTIGEGFALYEVIYNDAGKPYDFRFIDVNPTYERWIAQSKTQIIGKSMREINPNMEQAWLDFFIRIAETGEPGVLTDYSGFSSKWIEVHAFSVKNGQIGFILRDITERKRAEDALRVSEEKMRVLVNSLPDEVWYADKYKMVTLVNPAVLREFGDAAHRDSVEKIASSFEVYRPDGSPRPVEEAPPLRALCGKVVTNQEEIVRIPARNELRYRQVNASPVIDAGGNIIGSVSIVRDITEQKQVEKMLRETEERQAFLLKLSDALRPLADAAEIEEAACCLLGLHLGVNRAYYPEINEAEGVAKVEGQFLRGTTSSMKGIYPLSAYSWSLPFLRRDEPVIVEDIHQPDQVPQEDAAAMEMIQQLSLISVPLVKNGVLIGALTVSQDTPRVWKPEEVELVRETLERTWAAVQRARAEEALRKSEERLRLAINAARFVIWDADLVTWKATGYEVMEDLFGVSPSKDMTQALDIYHPDDRDRVLEEFNLAMEKGGEYQTEWRMPTKDGCLRMLTIGKVVKDSTGQAVRAFGVIQDITERKRAEEVLHENEERQSYLLKLSDAIRLLSGTESVRDVAIGILAEHLKVSQANYTDYYEDIGHAKIEDCSSSETSITGIHKMGDYSSFINILRSGSDLVIPDVLHYSDIPEDQRIRLAGLGFRAQISVPLVKEGKLIATLTVRQIDPRKWTPQEVSLVHETAERTWAAIERARVEEALRKSEEKFRVAMELSPDGFTILRPVRDTNGQIVDFSFIYQNAAIARLNGTDPIAAVGRRLLELLPFHQGTPFLESYLHVAQTGESCIFEAEYGLEIMSKPTWFRGVVVRMNGDIAILAQDITDRKSLEQKLESALHIAETNRLILEAVIQQMPVGIILTNAIGTQAKNNTAMDTIWRRNMAPDENIHSHAYVAYHPDGTEYRPEEWPLTRALVNDEVVIGEEMSFLRGDGTIGTLLCSSAAIKDESGATVAGIVIDADITDLRQAQDILLMVGEKNLLVEKEKTESLQKTIDMKDEFLLTITHEFKTPLSIINSALQTMEMTCGKDLTARIQKYHNMIKQNSNRQLRLVNNLLDVTRMGAGRLRTEKNNVDIVALTKSIVGSIAVYAEQKSLALSFASTMKSKTISLDDEKYERILLNLLSNAVKFTPAGQSITVDVSRKTARGMKQVCIQVKDTGIGIPEDKKDLIFEKFGQVGSTRTRQAEGSGIGLHLVKLLVELLGGEVALDSQVGSGSIFTVLLPDEKTEVLEEQAGLMTQEKNDRRLTEATALEFSDFQVL